METHECTDCGTEIDLNHQHCTTCIAAWAANNNYSDEYDSHPNGDYDERVRHEE